MSTLLLDTATGLAAYEPDGHGSAAPGGPTLDDLIAGTWLCLTQGRSAACPSCGGELRQAGAQRTSAGGCVSCGADLS